MDAQVPALERPRIFEQRPGLFVGDVEDRQPPMRRAGEVVMKTTMPRCRSEMYSFRSSFA
ncbi:MAG: hypothetical protein E6G19_08950 [Actinobacteria bacterium]|nr:MAG: hypothetical protein E6G19_08950 [Actinomycetota bacterium]